MEACRLAIRNLKKSFAVPVLRGIDLDIRPGEVHALVGENGAGKTTLVNILTGLLPADAGELSLDGEDYWPANPRGGFAAGVSFAAQELGLVDALNVAENIALRTLPGALSVIDRDALRARASATLGQLDAAHIDPAAVPGSLSLADRQLVELARAMSADCRLLILDEPTAALTAQQAASVHRHMAALAARGVSVIYISHRLKDVLEVADTVTVLRDGAIVSSQPAADTSADQLVQEMSGGVLMHHRGTQGARRLAQTLLEVRNLTTRDLLHPVGLACGAGEILGIAGLAGAGKSELLQAVFGLAQRTGGNVVRHLDDGDLSIGTAGEAMAAGMGFVAEDRQSMGLFPHLSVLGNVMTPGANSIGGSLRRSGSRGERRTVDELIKKLAVRCTGADQPVTELSGGNQQKTLLARWLRLDVQVLLLDEPTRGVDVATKQAIYDLLFELRQQGRSIVVASSENEELMTICDRILVLSNRQPAGEFLRDSWSEQAILAAAFSSFERHDDPTPVEVRS
jgi:ribose transport system ATP-binding protein